MSKTGAVFLNLSNIDFKIYENIVRDLSNNGWSINKNGSIYYMIDNSYEWCAAPVDSYPSVIKLIEASIGKNLATCMDLIWEDETTSIGLNFLNDKKLMVSISEEMKMLKSLQVIDFSWYLERISVLFKSVNVNGIECIYE